MSQSHEHYSGTRTALARTKSSSLSRVPTTRLDQARPDVVALTLVLEVVVLSTPLRIRSMPLLLRSHKCLSKRSTRTLSIVVPSLVAAHHSRTLGITMAHLPTPSVEVLRGISALPCHEEVDIGAIPSVVEVAAGYSSHNARRGGSIVTNTCCQSTFIIANSWQIACPA